MSTSTQPLATVEDLEARWNGSGELDALQAEAALMDASIFIRAYLGRRLDTDNITDVQKDVLIMVTCAMATRSLAVTMSDTLYGVTQISQTVSSFSEQKTFSNPTGDLYLTSAEKRLLARVFGQTTCYTIPTHIGYGEPNV